MTAGSPAARRGGGFAAVFCFLGLVEVVGVPAVVHAQNTTIPELLTFEGAAGVALERNPAFLRRVSAVEAAEQGERQSAGALLPRLSASVGFDGRSSRRRTAFDELGRALEEPDFVETTTSSASQALSGSVELLSLENLRSWSASRARTEAAEARVWLEAARLRTLVGVDYYDVVQREQLVAVEERALRMARDQLAAIRALMRVAARQPTDVLGAELDVARAEHALRQARGAARKAHLSLRERMGVAMETPFDVVAAFLPVFDPRPLDAASLVERARLGSPRMAEQRAMVEAAERGLSVARAARFPTISGSWGYSRGHSARDYDALGQLDLPNTGWSFGVALRVPLFDGFRASAAIGRARVDAEDARQSLREARLALEREVRAALIDLENAYAGVRLAERSAAIARERLRQGQAQYRQGLLQDYTLLQQMIDAVVRQERTVTAASHDFAVALLTLEEKVGGPLALPAADGVPDPAGR